MTKVLEYELDKEQQEIINDKSKYLLVIAGAGSGKTLTIIGKVKKLIEEENINPQEIICISFTNSTTNSLEEKLKKETNFKIPCYTFHKLAMDILKEQKINYSIADCTILEGIIHEFFEEKVLENKTLMNLLLKYYSQKQTKKIKENYLKLLKEKSQELSKLEKTISTFLKLFKCNNHKLEEFNIFLRKCKKTIHYKEYQKNKIFLIMTLNIYLQYEYYLQHNQELDFDDLIIEATNLVKQKGIKKKIKMIIIDEYQDTSYIRFCLIKEIIEKTDANLMVVGDDFQSIYRFTGCDISLFLNFKKYFPNAIQRKIQTTYRNSQELVTIAEKFIMKNKSQIKKQLHSNKHLVDPIEIIYCKNIKIEIKKILENISKKNEKSVMILGRNNKDINEILDEEWKRKDQNRLEYKKIPKLKIVFLTVHKSKGLEADEVIIINLKNDRLGFPTRIREEKILTLVTKNKEKMAYSEERRLFYVALTRTKNKIFLLCPKKNPSIFIKEIEKMKNVKCKKYK